MACIYDTNATIVPINIERIGMDPSEWVLDNVSKRIATERSIQQTRDALPRLSQAMRDYELIGWTSGDAWTGVSWYLELGDDGRYYIDPHIFNDEEPWCIRGCA